MQFIQGHDEPLYEAFARFKGLLRRCPNHGFEKDQQVGILYNGFNEQISSLLDSGANGGFLKKGADECMDVIEAMAENSRTWSKERHNTRRVAAAEDSDLLRKLEAMEDRLKMMESPKEQEPEDVNYIQNSGPNRNFNNNFRQNQGGGNYNGYQGNRPHPNLSYANNNYLQPPSGFTVGKGGTVIENPKNAELTNEKILAKLEGFEGFKKASEAQMSGMESKLSSLEKTVVSIASTVTAMSTQISQICQNRDEEVKAVSDRTRQRKKRWTVRYPAGAGTSSDPLDIVSESESEPQVILEKSSQPLEEVQRPMETSSDPLERAQRSVDEAQRSMEKACKELAGYVNDPLARARRSLEQVQRSLNKAVEKGEPLPALQMTPKRFKLEGQFQHFLRLFCKFHFNLPLIEALQDIPRYAKLLKDAVSQKPKLKPADLRLPHHCSDIIQKRRAVKQRDPGQFVIRCSIGSGKPKKALCDLGASINLMPLEYYQKLNIGPLAPTTMSLRMADGSSTKAVGTIEDVLVKVDDFIFPADFVILDMKTDKHVPLILGRNFLATCKALIDVGKGEITISDSHAKSTYHIASAMKKHEEAQAIKKEEECKQVILTDLSKPPNAPKDEGIPEPAVFIVYPHKVNAGKGKEKQGEKPSQGKGKKKKVRKDCEEEVYVLKTPGGKFRWWKKVATRLVPFHVGAVKCIQPIA